MIVLGILQYILDINDPINDLIFLFIRLTSGPFPYQHTVWQEYILY